MGTLRHLRSGKEYTLSSQDMVGRAPNCGLRINNPMVSAHHAELRWTGLDWQIHDLDSKNGTFLDQGRLKQGQHPKLMTGSQVAFGDPEDVYELTSDAGPIASARTSAGAHRNAQRGTLLLPNPDAPKCFIYQEHNHWFAESPDGVVRPISTGESLAIDGEVWTLDLPIALEPTRQLDALVLKYITLRFSVSRNEEHVELDLIAPSKQIRMPHHTYWYTLLTLARARLRDQDRPEISEAEAGWLDVDTLTEEQLKIHRDTLYKHISRARQDFAMQGVEDHTRLVERRLGAGQIRLGAHHLEILPL